MNLFCSTHRQQQDLKMNQQLLEALQNVMGHIDTPIGRRRLGIGS